jgi:hypothetical protein
MSIQTSFQADIRPLFTERDINAMTKAFNLANYDDVKAHAAAIYGRIRGIGGPVMPPPPPRGVVPGRKPGSSTSPSGWRMGTSPETGRQPVDLPRPEILPIPRPQRLLTRK